jgi:protocatechuate 3,4-dioxygenase beta subunit
MSQQRVGIVLAVVLAVGAVVGAGVYLMSDGDRGGASSPELTPYVAPPPVQPKRPTDATIKADAASTAQPKPVQREAFNPEAQRRSNRGMLLVGGTVVDPSGAGVPNATIELVFDSSAVISRAQEADVRGTFVTMLDGKFFFTNETCPTCALADGERYVLRITHPEYSAERITGVEASESENRIIMLSRGGNRLSGAIRDPRGAPLVGAEVRVYDLSVSTIEPDGALEKSGTSRQDGTYVVENLRPGLKKIWVVLKGYASTGRPTQNFEASQPETRIDFVLRQGQEIRGVVTAQDTGAGVGNAIVTLKPTRLGPPIPEHRPVDKGAIDDMRRRIAGGEDAETVKKDIVDALRERRSDGEAPRDAMERKRREMGVDPMAGDDGAHRDDEAAKARAEMARQQEVAAQTHNLHLTSIAFRTDKDGLFVADGLEGGSYQVTVTAAGYAPPPIQAAETGTTNVLFALIPNARISGRCVDDESGAPITSFTIGLATTPDQNSVPYHLRKSFSGPSSVDGSFEYVDVRPGTYFLIAEAHGYAGGRSQQVTVSQSERREGIEIRLRKGADVVGRVVDGEGKPVRDAVVSLDNAPSADPAAGAFVQLFMSQMRREVKSARTAEDGTYRIANVLSGRYGLKVRHPGYGPFDDPAAFDVPQTGEVARPDVVLVRGGSIRGFVRAKDGGPDGQAMVTIAPVGAVGMAQRQAQTDMNGRYEISGLAPGEYRVTLTMSGGNVDLGRLLSQAAFDAAKRGGGAVPAGMPPPPQTYMLQPGQILEIDF